NNRGAAVNLPATLYVLEEVELLVAGRGPKFVTHHDQALLRLFAFFVDDGDTRFLPEWRVGEHHVVSRRRLLVQAVSNDDRAPVAADAVQVEIHRGKSGRGVHNLGSAKGVELQMFLL